MADVGDTTGARPSARPDETSEDIDPVIPLLDIWRRQIEAWRALPAGADDLRNPVADMSWGATGLVLAQVGPTTVAGALLALRHVMARLRLDNPSADQDYPIPLAERALTTLERLTTA